MRMRDGVTHPTAGRHMLYPTSHKVGSPTPSTTTYSLERTFNPASCHAVSVGHGTATEVQVVTTVRDHTERTGRRHMFNRGPPAEPGNQHAHASSNLVLRISVPSPAARS
jgi:hypothetical protein